MKYFLSFSIPSLVLFILFACAPSADPPTEEAAKDDRKEVVLLGLWHFSNPGADEYNTTVENYFSDRRQQEINQVNQALAKYNPSKVFVECMSSDQAYFDSLYQEKDFDPQKLANSRGTSEHYQIGFKLSKMLGLNGVECVDAPGLWLGSAANEVAAKQYPALDAAFTKKMEEHIHEENQFLKEHSIAEGLVRYNTKESLGLNHDIYISFFSSIIDQSKEEDFPVFYKDEKEDRLAISPDQKYIGAELISEWYRRNIKIFSKVLERVEEDDDRILIIFGQGHIPILRRMFDDHPKYRIVEVAEVL